MAGTIIADYIRTDANKLSLNVGNTTFATINAMGLLSNTGTTIIAANGAISASSIAGGTLNGNLLGAGSVGRTSLHTGAVLQVVTATKSDTQSYAGGTTPADISGLSLSITPTSSTSKILCMWNIMYSADASNYGGIRFNLFRDSTKFGGTAVGSRLSTTSGGYNFYGIASNSINYDAMPASGHYVDSPSSTSALTYKMQVLGVSGSGYIHLNRSYADTDIAGMSRFISTLTVMEIAA